MVIGAGAGEVFDPDVAMHVQIYRQLRAEIVDGLWFGREDFPGEKEVAARFAVSVMTSRAALERLSREGLVDRGRGRRGRAIFVPSASEPPTMDLFPPPERRTPLRYSLLSSRVDTAPADACRAFGQPAGSKLWQSERVVKLKGQVYAVIHNAQLPEVGLRHRPRDLARRPMIAILATQGINVAQISRQIQATTAPPVVARHLGLTMDSPVLVVILRVRDDQDHVVEWVRAFGHPHRSLGEDVLDLQSGVWTTRTD